MFNDSEQGHFAFLWNCCWWNLISLFPIFFLQWAVYFLLKYFFLYDSKIFQNKRVIHILARLVFSRFFDFRENLDNVKEKPARKSWFHASTLQNFARRNFFDVNEVSIVYSWKIYIKTGESIWKGLFPKAL